MQTRSDSYNFFASLLLTLPDKDFVRKIRGLALPDDGVPALLKKYIEETKNLSDEEVLQEIAVDRTYLLRGLTENGPRPPYESLYLRVSPSETIGGVNVFYANNNYAVSPDIHEPGDYIGVELSFMKELCLLEASSDGELKSGYLSRQKEFYEKHLGRWIKDWAREIITYAKTDFYRAIGHMLKDFIAEEEQVLEMMMKI